MADLYGSMTELMENTEQGKDWEIHFEEKHPNVLIAAIHGGAIEIGTSEITKLTSEIGDYSYFRFEGIRPSNNSELHVTSTNYDEPNVMRLAANRNIFVTFHGARGDEEITYIGGLDIALRNAVWKELERKGFRVEESPSHLVGENPINITNRTLKGAGVQLELTSQMRKSFFKNYDWSRVSRENRENWTDNLYNYAEAVTTAITKYENKLRSDAKTSYNMKMNGTLDFGKGEFHYTRENAEFYSEDASNMKRGYVDTDIINIQGEKGGVEINEYGVNVRNGDFTLEDDVSAEKYTLTRKTNLIFDHSFEMIDRGTGDRAVSHGDGWYSWRTFGTPYVVTNKRSSTFYDIMFGSTMVEVDRTHGLEQYVELEPNTTYTYSAHCQTSTRTINGASLYLFVEFYDADGNSIGRPGRTMPKTPADDDCIIRYALTFKTPSNLDYARFAVVSSTAGQWIAVDGVQVVKGDIPSIYDPEDSLWGMRTNYKDKNPAFSDGMNMNGPLEVNPSEIDKGIIIPYHGIHTATSNLYVGADNEVRITDKNLYNDGSPRYRTLRAGDIYSNGVKVTSTIKEKTNIEPLEEDVINVLKDVNIYKFHYKQDIDDLNLENVQVGPMAESVPQIMRGSDNDSINTHSMTSILWRVCQKQQEQIEALDSNIKDLEMIIEEQQYQIGETENLIKQNEDKAD